MTSRAPRHSATRKRLPAIVLTLVAVMGCNGSADDKSEAGRTSTKGPGVGATSPGSSAPATSVATNTQTPEARNTGSGEAETARSSFQEKSVPGGAPIGESSTTKADAPAPSLNTGKETTTASGLQYLDLEVGSGAQPTRGQQVVVQIVGWLESGKQFSNTHSDDKPLECQIGIGHLLRGLEEGIASMKVGGKRRLRVPPDLGYGKKGSELQGVPPDATLIFEIELLELR